ncbi:beta-phosphoglucomutase [Psittacicella hinzii]|uniref:Beta-phosphoglucomutase n=1 Tax=Psittacicella hinzii TaxID=2028575 RepID=A0A3A1Y7W0_9GAMM|nr:beta-phosphoglucomutase [Psittacicella hinzii]RIY34383.1 beta-phosphoglucomutase [Psittacicella hinzii]
MSFKGVLFDLDGVITDTAEFHYLAWKELADKLGISIDREFNEQLKGVDRDESLRRILAFGGKLEEYDAEQRQALATDKNKEYSKMIAQMTPDNVLPGIVTFLEQLKAAGKKLALASASKNAPAILERLGLSHYFEVIANPTLAKSKPAPDIFLLAAQGLGLEPQECIGIEDSAAGIQAIIDAQALPVGVGSAQNLGENIALVDSTAKLNLQFLEQVWQEAHSQK